MIHDIHNLVGNGDFFDDLFPLFDPLNAAAATGLLVEIFFGDFAALLSVMLVVVANAFVGGCVVGLTAYCLAVYCLTAYCSLFCDIGPQLLEFLDGLGSDSIEKIEFWLEKSLEFWLEIPYT